MVESRPRKPVAEAAPDAVRQKYLGNKGTIVFLALLSAFIPLSTDLYLPALPAMTKYFHVSEYLLNMTLVVFFFFYALTGLAWGSLSDKFGRRPILFAGMATYAVAGVLCAFAPSIYWLVFFRMLQAAGAGAGSAVAAAIVKDSYKGKRRETVLAIVSSMTLISPALGPVIGAWLLHFTSWKGSFIAQAVLGVIVFLGAVAYRETLRVRGQGNLRQTLGRLGYVVSNRRFVALLLIFEALSIVTMAFIAASSYVYQNMFGVSSQVYSYYFAVIALIMISGPYIYLWSARRFERSALILFGFVVLALSGVLVLTLGGTAPWVLTLTVMPIMVTASFLSAPAQYLLLDQHAGDAGSTAAVISSSQTVIGTIGILVVSPNINMIALIGVLALALGACCGAAWFILSRRMAASQAATGAQSEVRHASQS